MRHGNRWARLLAAVCAMALFLSVISPALAAKYPYDTISMDDVNMRSRANTTSTILKKIQKGDTVTILGVTGSFYRVEFDGKTGYAMKKYIDGTDPSPDPSPNPALSMQAPPAISEYPYDKPAQRMVVAQAGPLSYVCVATEGPENPGSVGLTIPQMAEFMGTLDVQSAYNLDGGSSSTMVLNNEKINALSTHKVRSICDILYFATLVNQE